MNAFILRIAVIVKLPVAFTMDVYSHIIEGMQSDAMALLNDVLPSGKSSFQKNNANLTLTSDIMVSNN